MWSAKCPKCGAKILLEDANAKVVQCASCGAQVRVNINVNYNYSKSEHTEHIVDDAKSRRQKTLKNSVLTKNGPPLSTKNMPARLGAQLPRQSITIVPMNGKSSSASFSLLLFSLAAAFTIPSIKSGNRNLPPIRPSLPA